MTLTLYLENVNSPWFIQIVRTHKGVERRWLKYLHGIREDLQGQERTHKYQMHFIKSDRHFQKICI